MTGVPVVFLVILSIMASANAGQTETIGEFVPFKSVATSHTTLENYSKSKCLSRCMVAAGQGMCTLAGYNRQTKTCKLSLDTEGSLLTVQDANIGVMYLTLAPTAPGPPSCGATDYLVTGANPIPTTSITASSVFDGIHLSEFATLYNVWTTSNPGAWAPLDADFFANTSYIQTQFNSLSTVISVLTQGPPFNTASCCTHWSTSFWISTSLDCVTFDFVVDGAAQQLVFPGNTDLETVVENALPVPRNALCLRLHPISDGVRMCMRLDVIGCPAV